MYMYIENLENFHMQMCNDMNIFLHINPYSLNEIGGHSNYNKRGCLPVLDECKLLTNTIMYVANVPCSFRVAVSNMEHERNKV
jgi:hypothetical protein